MNKRFLRDAGERIGATFLEAAIGSVLLAGTLNLTVAKSAALTGTLAALTLVKTLLARFTGDRDSASALPTEVPADI